MTKILHVVTNVGSYDGDSHPTGLWLSELAHAWEIFEAAGYEQFIVSPRGGATPLEPRSLKFPAYDKATKAFHANAALMERLEHTLAPDEVDPAQFDAIYFTGGHAVMYDFPDSAPLQAITRAIWESGGVVSSVCHGYCGLLNTTLSDGTLLVSGRTVTGFSWAEEVVAGVSRLVPYNAEQAMQERGAHYVKAALPFVSYVVDDGRLVTGQNPGSARATAERVVSVLKLRGA